MLAMFAGHIIGMFLKIQSVRFRSSRVAPREAAREERGEERRREAAGGGKVRHRSIMMSLINVEKC
jgi:hypothetical protein